MSEIIHKTEPIEHWIVDGKAYRLATEKDVGKECLRSDIDIEIAMGNLRSELVAFRAGEEYPYIFDTKWRFAYVQDDSLLTPPEATPYTKPIDWTKPVRTKDGRAVRVLCTDGPGDYPVCGYIDGERNPRSWTLDGYFHINERHRTLDLENAPRRVKKTWWMNVFDDGSFDHYETKELADSDRGRGIFACVPFPIDCEEGEGL